MNKSKQPIIDHIPAFLEYLEIEKGLASKTQENYSRYLNKFVKWLKINKDEGLCPYDLTADHLWKYRLFLSKSPIDATSGSKPLKKRTQNYYLIALRNLFSYFTDRDILCLPADKIKLAKNKTSAVVKFLNLEQVVRLLEAPIVSHNIGLRDRAIMESLFSTGLRVAELIALNRSQFVLKKDTEDFEVGIIGKGSRPRTVYFSARTIEWLKKYLDSRQDMDKALFINYTTAKNSQVSRRLTARSIERILEKYSKIAGLPIMATPHTLRHSYATDLLTKGVDLRTVQEFLGHKNIATTQIYTHITNKRLKDIHKKFHSGNQGL